jgi:hypothetical protein
MSEDLKLTIELVPRTSWFSNVRNEVEKRVWDSIRRACYKKAAYRCEICGGKGDKWPVECHEIWEYDDETYIQRLAGFIALCPSCHLVKHYGFASLNDKEEEAFNHFRKINHLSPGVAESYIDVAYRTWEERSQSKWQIDISILQKYGVRLALEEE